jgi:hypothetical protein
MSPPRGSRSQAEHIVTGRPAGTRPVTGSISSFAQQVQATRAGGSRATVAVRSWETSVSALLDVGLLPGIRAAACRDRRRLTGASGHASIPLAGEQRGWRFADSAVG